MMSSPTLFSVRGLIAFLFTLSSFLSYKLLKALHAATTQKELINTGRMTASMGLKKRYPIGPIKDEKKLFSNLIKSATSFKEISSDKQNTS